MRAVRHTDVLWQYVGLTLQWQVKDLTSYGSPQG